MAALMSLVMGLRAGEVVSRVVRDLDDEGRLLWIPDSKTEAGKRTLQVPDFLRPYLLAARGGEEVGRPALRVPRRNWPRKWVQRICKAAGVPRVTAHGMRGLHGTLAVETGMSAHAVAAALGHESVTTTLRELRQGGSRSERPAATSVLRVLSGGLREQDSAA